MNYTSKFKLDQCSRSQTDPFITQELEKLLQNITLIETEMLAASDYVMALLQQKHDYYYRKIEYLLYWCNTTTEELKEFYRDANDEDWSVYLKR